jgi:hypothetical protein
MFAKKLQTIMLWLDNDARRLSKDDLLDGFRTRVLELTRDFVAYPHCENFSLMPPSSSSGSQI